VNKQKEIGDDEEYEVGMADAWMMVGHWIGELIFFCVVVDAG